MAQSRRTKIALLLTMVVLAAGGFFLWATDEPSYQGRSLSSWVAGYNRAPFHNPEIDQAIRKMGEKGLPHLVKLLGRKESDPSQRLAALFRKQTIIQAHFLSAEEWRLKAAQGIQVLGDDAEAALPDLHKLLDDPETARMAIVSTLNSSGVNLPLLKRGLAHTNDVVREMAVGVISHGKIRQDVTIYPALLVPILQEKLKDPVRGIRQFAAHFLARHSDLEIGIAALLSNIQDPDWAVRFAAASEFQVFGEKAEVAIPRLLELREDPGIRKEVEMALEFIRAASGNKKESAPLEGTRSDPNF